METQLTLQILWICLMKTILRNLSSSFIRCTATEVILSSHITPWGQRWASLAEFVLCMSEVYRILPVPNSWQPLQQWLCHFLEPSENMVSYQVLTEPNNFFSLGLPLFCTCIYFRWSCSSLSILIHTLSSENPWLVLFNMVVIVYPSAINPPRRRTVTSKLIRG